MGQVKVLGEILRPGVGGAVYEDTSAHKVLAERQDTGEITEVVAASDTATSLSQTAVMSKDVYGPHHWADLTDWEGRTAADRAMQRAAALQNLHLRVMVPLERSAGSVVSSTAVGRAVASHRRRRDRFVPPKPMKLVRDRRKLWYVLAWVGSVLTTASGMSAVFIGTLNNLTCFK